MRPCSLISSQGECAYIYIYTHTYYMHVCIHTHTICVYIFSLHTYIHILYLSRSIYLYGLDFIMYLFKRCMGILLPVFLYVRDDVSVSYVLKQLIWVQTSQTVWLHFPPSTTFLSWIHCFPSVTFHFTKLILSLIYLITWRIICLKCFFLLMGVSSTLMRISHLDHIMKVIIIIWGLSPCHFTWISSYSSSFCIQYLCINPMLMLSSKWYPWMKRVLSGPVKTGVGGAREKNWDSKYLEFKHIFSKYFLTNFQAWVCPQLQCSLLSSC